MLIPMHLHYETLANLLEIIFTLFLALVCLCIVLFFLKKKQCVG